MDRDCGKGRLIPVKYTLVWAVGQSDEETSKKISDPFSKEYEDMLVTLPAYSNIRMYAWDTAGYANCIRSAFVDKNGVATEATNRLTELP